MQPSLKRHLVTGGAWVVVGKTVTAGSGLIVRALLSRLLTPEEFGVFAKAFSLVLVASMLSQLGLHQAVVRFVAEWMGAGRVARARAVVGLVYRYALLGVVGAMALLLLGPGAWLARDLWHSELLAGSMGAVSAWFAFKSFEVITSETFRGFKDLRWAATFGGAISGLLNVAVLLVLWKASVDTGLGLALRVIAASTALSLLIGLIVLRRKLRPLATGESVPPAEVFSIAVPLWINGLVTYLLLQSDIWILGAFIPDDELAIYAAAAYVVALVSQSLILVNLVVPPFIADLYARGERGRLERILRTTATLAGLPAFAVLLAFIVFGKPILGWVYTEHYRAGAIVLALLSVGKMVNVLTGSCGVALAMTGHQKILMRITLVTAVLTIGGNLLVVKDYGTVGVAAVVCGGTIVQNLAMWIATRRVAGLWTHMARPSTAAVRELIRRRR
jgi:O-antigen/teichoic acid export membrane protein